MIFDTRKSKTFAIIGFVVVCVFLLVHQKIQTTKNNNILEMGFIHQLKCNILDEF